MDHFWKSSIWLIKEILKQFDKGDQYCSEIGDIRLEEIRGVAVILTDLGIPLVKGSISVLPTFVGFSGGNSKDLDFLISHQNVSKERHRRSDNQTTQKSDM